MTSSVKWAELVAHADDPQPLMVDERMSEQAFQHEIVRYATQQGWLVHYDIPARRRGMLRTQQGGDNGYPDLTLVRNGIIIFAELKAQHGTYSAEQKAWRDALGAAWRGWKPRDAQMIAKELA